MENYDHINWVGLITDLLEIMVITKIKLALKCDVTETSVSNWTIGKRTPQGFARHVILQQAKDNDLNLNDYKIKRPSKKATAEKLDHGNSMAKDVTDFAIMLSSLPKKQQKQIIEMADLMIDTYNSDN